MGKEIENTEFVSDYNLTIGRKWHFVFHKESEDFTESEAEDIQEAANVSQAAFDTEMVSQVGWYSGLPTWRKTAMRNAAKGPNQ